MNKCGNGVAWFAAAAAAATWLSSMADLRAAQGNLKLVFSAAADNDLYRAMTAAGQSYPRYANAKEAVEAAPPGAGVLILADGYPKTATVIEPAVFDQAAKKNLRLYVEYPAALPDLAVGRPRATQLERVVVCADAFGDSMFLPHRPASRSAIFFAGGQAGQPALRLAGLPGLPAKKTLKTGCPACR